MNWMSPSAGQGVRDTGFKNIDEPSMTSFSTALKGLQKFSITSSPMTPALSPSIKLPKQRFCACGLPLQGGEDACETCKGTNSVHIEGDIWKKQKKGNVLKKYWFVLLGKELYSYKHQADGRHEEKHKDM